MRVESGLVRRVSLMAVVLLGLNTAVARAEIARSVAAGPVLVSGLGNHHVAWLVGGSGEVLGGRYALGGDAHYIHFPDYPAFGGVIVAIRGSQYFRRDTGARAQPFATAGFSLLVADGMVWPTAHVGGGVDWWTSERTAMRVEVREDLLGFLSFRCGVVFRPSREGSRASGSGRR